MRNKSLPPAIETGLYRGWKGGIYRVTGVILETTNHAPEDQWKVRYQDEPQKYIGDVAVEYARNYEEFIESVPDPNGGDESLPRFAKLD